jgi:hypothetical protein
MISVLGVATAGHDRTKPTINPQSPNEFHSARQAIDIPPPFFRE